MFFCKFPRFSGYSRPSSSTIRSAFFTLELPQSADGHVCVNKLINPILQHAIERVGRPGGSHEGVGRKNQLYAPRCGKTRIVAWRL